MEALESILSRRSIRKYKDKEISKDLIEKLLKAAMAAPSAGNQQPWHFVIITERDVLNTIPEFHPYSEMLKEAPLAILVCADETLEKHRGYWIQDCSAATENLLLAAHALGLGACWIAIFPHDDRVFGMRHLLSVPEHAIPFALIAVGHPAEKKSPAERYSKSRVHYNQW